MSGYRSLHALGDLADPDPPGARTSRYLHPGEWLVSTDPCAVTTILASCVAVCLWDPERRLGGINHFLLPTGTRNAQHPARYGSLAIPRLIEEMKSHHCLPRNMRAKLFGGSCRAAAMPGADLGARNIALAKEVLDEYEIPIVATDTGGERPRKLVLHTDDFSVWLWRI